MAAGDDGDPALLDQQLSGLGLNLQAPPDLVGWQAFVDQVR